MPSDSSQDAILQRFRVAAAAAYGNRLDRMVLFGSRARGDASEESDYDIAVFLNESAGLWLESETLAKVATDILFDSGAVINALPFPAESYSDLTPLMSELRRDGREL